MAPEDEESSASRERVGLFGIPDYRRWFIADTAEAVGSGLRRFAVPLVAVSLAGPGAAGIMAGSIDALSIVGMMAGGLLADRYARRRIVLATAPITLAVWALAAVAAALDFLSFPLLFVLACVAIVAASIGESSGEAILRNIVPAKIYPRALSLNFGRGAAIQVGSGPIGGLLLAISTAIPFAANAVATVIRIVGISRITLDESGRRAPSRPAGRGGLAGLLVEAVAGLTWIVRRPLPRTLALVAVLLNLGFQVILQTLVFDYQQRGFNTALIGLLSAGMALGVLLGSLISAHVVERVRSGVILPAAFSWLLATAILLTVTDSVYVCAAILILTGLALPTLNATSFGFLMVAAPKDHQGRVFSGQDLLGMAALPLGLALGGIALDVWGRQPTMYAALVPLTIAVAWMILSKTTRGIPASGEWDTFVADQPGLG